MTRQVLEDCIATANKLDKLWLENYLAKREPSEDKEYAELWQYYYTETNKEVGYDLINALISYCKRKNLTINHIVKALKALEIKVVAK